MLLLGCLLPLPGLLAQLEYEQSAVVADSIRSAQESMLNRKVPEIFQDQRLLFKAYPDSSWQVFRGDTLLPAAEVLRMMGESQTLDEYDFLEKVTDDLFQQVRETRLISTASAIGGSFYISLYYRDWVRVIPGFLALGFSGWKYFESRAIEKELKRQLYHLNNLMPPHRVETWVEVYNFRLYQKLSKEPIHFRTGP